MVKFLLDAGADQEHKTDEMHTALMEASMVQYDIYCSHIIELSQILSCRCLIIYPSGKYHLHKPFN
jgi:hypothetical protein